MNQEERSRLCLKCGWCCKYHVQMMPSINPELKELFEIRGMDVRIEEEKAYIATHAPCQHLQEDNKCALYGTGKRPQVCRNFKDASQTVCPQTIENCLIYQIIKRGKK